MTSIDSSLNAMNYVKNKFLRCLNNPILKGHIYAIGVYDKGEVKKKKDIQEAYELGKLI